MKLYYIIYMFGFSVVQIKDYPKRIFQKTVLISQYRLQVGQLLIQLIS